MLATLLLSYAGDGAAEATWLWRDVTVESCWRRCCRVILMMALSRQLGRGMTGVGIYDRSRDV
jgi:hypothetical protein